MGVYPHVDKTLELARRFDRAKLAADSVRSNHLNPIGFYNDELHQTALMRSRLLEDFRSSLDQHRFKVFFQPKFDIRPGKPMLSSAEALVRWIHPELGFVNPGQFIPLLEESGLILELDRFVWRETAKQIRRWKDEFGFSVPVSVNVSRIDMLSPDLRNVFAEILEQNHLSADDLILEITESAYTGDSAQVINTARDLRGMGLGFRIEMDDFGTGYSSLGMLTQLPIDALKLDMTFVRSAFGETRDVRMIELIIDIADYLHVPVVAEGVETEEQLLVLKALGCDLIQGYYFSKPVPAEEFERFLLERQKLNVQPQAETRASYQSLTKALTYEFDRIYYIDLSAGSYLEFSSGEAGELRIRPDGVDFFGTEEPRLLEGADPAEAEKLRAALTRDALRKTVETEESVNLSWKRGGEKPCICRLRSMRTRNRDDHHLALGFRMEA